MPRQIIRNYPDRVAKRSIICEYMYLGKLCARTQASSLDRAIARVPRNLSKYGVSKVVIRSRRHGDILATAKVRDTRHSTSIHLWRVR